MLCPNCHGVTVWNDTAPDTDDGYWCENCQTMTYKEAD